MCALVTGVQTCALPISRALLVHAPCLGRRLHQQGAGGGAGAAKLLVGVGEAGTAAGALHRAPAKVVVEAGVGRRVRGAELAPVGIHLLGHQGGEAGEGDRRSVVEVKSVLVRVALGGCPSIKKKKKRTTP